MLLSPTASRAQNRGVYPLGMSAINSGVTPSPGFTYANQLLYYHRDQAKDDDGDTLPVTGENSVTMDMNTITWVSDMMLLGARYAASATIPIAKNSLTSDLHGPISGGSGLADSYYLPVILGWSRERADVKAMYGFLAPTGSFEGDADDNVGSGYWTHTLSSGQTFQLTPNRALTLSLFEMYELHTEQEDSGIHPGDTFDFDYSLMAALPIAESVRLQAGLAGYAARQTTARTGPGVTPAEEDERYRVNGFGFAVNAAFPQQRATLGFKYFDELANRSTFEGYSLQVVGAISF